ncbi:ABC transporter substrate-binding protein [Cellulomonas sp. URHE0023]|uniref:ABC transporter substrate-binding protein n=1 Tax=Cellulomonas sp. URHE0023 TaxID=1380354 RepID=UPI000AF8CCDB|nr:ABC transporter substrate-binding protein [Cellulomonas sp. URHE0023]
MRSGSRLTVVAVAALVAAVPTLTGCTDPAPQPDRPGTVVVAVPAPFTSLNGGTVQGRDPGSALVLGLAQSGFVSLDENGAAVLDPSFGTVEKVADAPLTVKYTIAPEATWSDGVPVTADDLVLEWAARSGQLDDVIPELDALGAVTNDDALAAGVAFAAASPALVYAEQPPVVDGATVTVTYTAPVADWQVALDVGVPAHVVGQTALGVEDPAAAATAVTTAITGEDKVALGSISSTWRTQFDADALSQHLDLAVSDGPYAVDRIVPGKRVELVRNEKYTGDRPAAYDRIVLRSDVDPLDEVSALSTGRIDVIAPVDTADVLDALADVEGATVRTGGDSTLQLQLQVAGGGAFDDATYGGDAATATAIRTAFLLTVPRDAIVDGLVKPLWSDATVSGAVLPQVGPDAGSSSPQDGSADISQAKSVLESANVTDQVVVRVLTNTADPLRTAMLEKITDSAAEAGFEVRPYTPVQAWAADLRGAPESWDVALVPVPQADLPVSSVVTRWQTDGVANLTGWSDQVTDQAASALTTTLDPSAVPAALDPVAGGLAAGGAVASIVQQPVVVAQRPLPDGSELPEIEPLALGRADLTSWWDWARK